MEEWKVKLLPITTFFISVKVECCDSSSITLTWVYYNTIFIINQPKQLHALAKFAACQKIL